MTLTEKFDKVANFNTLTKIVDTKSVTTIKKIYTEISGIDTELKDAGLNNEFTDKWISDIVLTCLNKLQDLPKEYEQKLDSIFDSINDGISDSGETLTKTKSLKRNVSTLSTLLNDMKGYVEKFSEKAQDRYNKVVDDTSITTELINTYIDECK